MHLFALLLLLQGAAAQEPEHTEHTETVEIEEEVVVTATRTGKRVQDQAVRVEVLGREEIEEKLLMTPGDVTMMLNETGGLRVQVASPSLGAASVRVQGLRGRYTQVLSDGLPLYGGQTGSIGLLQIPPVDLGQVEVIKGPASAFYGTSALGGVVNLVSRAAPEDVEREVLLNRTTRGGTDGVLWLAGRGEEGPGLTLLGGLHAQEAADVDDDGWADMPAYFRALARPRLSWQDDQGRSLFATVGFLDEDRRGGTLEGSTVPDGTPYREALDTRRLDVGLVARLATGGARLLTLRASGMSQSHAHRFGDALERDRHRTLLVEGSMAGTSGRHTWVAGGALQVDTYHARDVAGFDFAYEVPGLFVQDDVLLGRVTLSASARLDWHEEHGTLFAPRGSVLVKPGAWTLRASLGSGYFAPTPFTEETEAVGLRNVQPLGELEVERAWSASFDVARALGPVELNGTVFASRVLDPVAVVDGPTLALVTAGGPTRTAGLELLARLRMGSYVATASYTLTDASEVEVESGQRIEVPLTPLHAAGLVVAWEQHGRARVGFELYFTGRQQLDGDPYRETSVPYAVVGLLAERRFGPLRAFVNLENLGDARQTRHQPIVRPSPGPGGRWTVDAWGPLEGRTVNAGIRWAF